MTDQGKSSKGMKASSGGPGFVDGDWSCVDVECGNVNFARRTACNRCGKERPELSLKKVTGTLIGKAAAQKSRGLFSADDWQCKKCGNVNWARRNQCNLCNAPKFGDIEERTGYGGGYNERGVVEYVKREDSDDEFDELGRKKKKRDASERASKSSSDDANDKKSENSDKGEEEEDEEEDDEDDDGDLSKYDLSGWGDDEDEKKDEKITNTEDGNDRTLHLQPFQNSKRRERDEKRRSRSRSSEKSRSRSRSPLNRK